MPYNQRSPWQRDNKDRATDGLKAAGWLKNYAARKTIRGIIAMASPSRLDYRAEVFMKAMGWRGERVKFG
jgi:hypothetical protein